MRLAWLTDIHMNFVTSQEADAFALRVAETGADLVLVTGDIAEAPTLASTLAQLARGSQAKILYVLGNHDFYKGRVEPVRALARHLTTGRYLHGREPFRLTDAACIVGVDGWADGLYGRPYESDLIFTDWVLIEDFREVDAAMNMRQRLRLLERMGQESATALRASLDEAVQKYRRVLVLTHVPPFARAAGHNGSAMADLWVPWLACKSTGDVLLEFAAQHPDVEFEVLCGHTHVARSTQELPNLKIKTGSATYREPEIQRVWDVD